MARSSLVNLLRGLALDIEREQRLARGEPVDRSRRGLIGGGAALAGTAAYRLQAA